MSFRNPEDFAVALKEKLQEKYELSEEHFDGQGFPRIRSLADVYHGIDIPAPLTEDEQRSADIKKVTFQLTSLLDTYGADLFREALKKVPAKEQMGISLKRTWDEGEANLIINERTSDIDPF